MASDAELIATALGGHRHGAQWMAKCPVHDDRTPSLAIRQSGARVLLRCHAGCDQADVIDALRARGLWGATTGSGRPPPPTAAEDRTKADTERSDQARDIWRDCTSIDVDSVAGGYLVNRGLTIAPPPTLRAHPGLLHQPTGLRLPALVAAVQGPDRGIVAIHRTFLDARGRKAQVSAPRLALGPLGAGAVRLAAAGPVLGLAEGVETALSAMMLYELPTWSSLGASRLHLVHLPDVVAEVILFADNDGPGREAADRALARYAAAARVVRVMLPPAGHKDFNDVLLARRAAA